jgi:hypothetical protein
MQNARILNGKKVAYPKNMKNPLNLPFLLGTDEIKLPDGWEQTCMACPMQYEKIIRIRKTYYVGYIRSRWDYPFSIEIFRTKTPENWTDTSVIIKTIKSVDMCEDNPPFKSMRIVDKFFKELSK